VLSVAHTSAVFDCAKTRFGPIHRDMLTKSQKAVRVTWVTESKRESMVSWYDLGRWHLDCVNDARLRGYVGY
jgi:hypothetical protein